MHENAGASDKGDVGVTSTAPTVCREEPSVTATVALREGHHRCELFTCERSPRVQKFLRDDRLRLAGPGKTNIFVLEDPNDTTRVLGYYCLSAGHIEREWVSNKLRRQIARELAPMALLGFMGRDDSASKGTGALLLADATIRVSRIEDLAVWGIMLHAENDSLAKWYTERGFKLAPDEKVGERNKLLMYAPLASLVP
jgi:hypothetical protein